MLTCCEFIVYKHCQRHKREETEQIQRTVEDGEVSRLQEHKQMVRAHVDKHDAHADIPMIVCHAARVDDGANRVHGREVGEGADKHGPQEPHPEILHDVRFTCDRVATVPVVLG